MLPKYETQCQPGFVKNRTLNSRLYTKKKIIVILIIISITISIKYNKVFPYEPDTVHLQYNTNTFSEVRHW